MDKETGQKICPKFIFLAPVCGAPYVETFLNAVLPSLLTDGNLPSLDSGGGEFRILTTYCDARAIAKAPIFSDLRKTLDVGFILLDGLIDLSNFYEAMPDCYKIGMRDASGEAYFVFLTADAFWSNGTICALRQRIAEGYYAVMVLALRVERSKFMDGVSRLMADPGRGLKGISTDELLGIALNNLHPIAETLNVVGSSFADQWPSHLYWIEVGQRLVAHGFHLHPLMVKHPARASALHFKGRIDTGFLESLRYPFDKFHVVRDSSEILGIDLTPEDRACSRTASRAYYAQIGRWAMIHANKYHWHFFQYPVVFSASGSEYDAMSVYDPILEEHRSLLVSRIMRYRTSAWFVRPTVNIVYKTKRWLTRLAIRLASLLGRLIAKIHRQLR